MKSFDQLLFEWIFQGQSEWMSSLTYGYMTGLICLFLFFFVVYLVPVIIRFVQIKVNYWFIYLNIRKAEDLSEKRKKIQSKIFKNTSWARDLYHNFRVTWEDTRLPNEDKAVYPIRLKELLTPEIVIDRAVNRRIAEALPGIFIALGIFGTFLGLVLGLKGLKIDELANLKQGVGQLLSGLSLAFYTSLLGIALSVLFSFLYRFLVRRLEKALFRLDELFVTLFPYHSYERYLRKYLELQADVKQGLQTLATDVATKIKDTIAPAMDEALVKHLVPIMQDLQIQIRNGIEDSKRQQLKILGNFGDHIEKMSSVITEHFEDSQKKQSEAMESVLKQYVEKMSESFMVQFQDMGQIIEDTTKVQSEIKAQMVQFTEQLQKQFQVQTELIEKTSRAAQILNESLESLEGISRELKSSADYIASAASLLEESASKAKEGQETLRESVDEQIQAMTTTREELEKAWNTITSNTDSTIHLVREVIQDLAEGVGDQLNKALTAFDSAVAEVVERFSGTLFETNQTIEELPAVLTKMGENFESIRTDISSQKDILNELKNLTSDMIAPNIESAVKASNELSKTANIITKSTKELTGWFNDVMERIKSQGLKEAFETLNGSLESLKDQVEKIAEGDGKANEELLKRVKFIAARANDVTKDIRSGLFEELKSIKDSTGKIVEAADKLRESLSQPESRRGLFGRIRKI